MDETFSSFETSSRNSNEPQRNIKSTKTIQSIPRDAYWRGLGVWGGYQARPPPTSPSPTLHDRERARTRPSGQPVSRSGKAEKERISFDAASSLAKPHLCCEVVPSVVCDLIEVVRFRILKGTALQSNESALGSCREKGGEGAKERKSGGQMVSKGDRERVILFPSLSLFIFIFLLLFYTSFLFFFFFTSSLSFFLAQ